VLEVVDNGMGFELRPARELLSEGHHGLVNIIERAELVGGDLSVISGPVEGTDIRLQIPSTTVEVA
jgi:signal transduction histidine kinase